MSQPENDRPWMGPLPAASGCDCHICRPDESYDELDRRTIDTILEHGWQVVSVAEEAGCSDPDHDHDSSDDHDEPEPAFTYTVGLGHRAGHPELLMSGLDHRVMHHALNQIAQRVMAGRRLVPGEALEGVLAGVPLVIEQVSDTALAETVTWSGWFHRRKPAAFAVVWPDRNGVFAWQPGAPDILEDLQPHRWRVPIEHTGGLATDPEWTFPVPPDFSVFSCTHIVDEGGSILWAARQRNDPEGEDWTLHCGAEGHETDEIRLSHFAHLVRSAPSLRAISDLGLDQEALRNDTDSPWRRAPLPD